MLKIIFRFSLIIIALLILFQLSRVSAFIPEISFDVILAFGALVLLGLGAYIGWISKQKAPEISPPISEINHQKIEELSLSSREMEVLDLLSRGLSNLEIANQLFLSESTVKTHVSNLFVKLDVKRRTQAVAKAKELNII